MTPTAQQICATDLTTPSRRFPIMPRLVSEFTPDAHGVEVAMAQYGGVTFVAIKPTADTDVTTSVTAETDLPPQDAGMPEDLWLEPDDEHAKLLAGYSGFVDTDEDYAAWAAA